MTRTIAIEPSGWHSSRGSPRPLLSLSVSPALLHVGSMMAGAEWAKSSRRSGAGGVGLSGQWQSSRMAVWPTDRKRKLFPFRFRIQLASQRDSTDGKRKRKQNPTDWRDDYERLNERNSMKISK
jgi:hypothetical protein